MSKKNCTILLFLCLGCLTVCAGGLILDPDCDKPELGEMSITEGNRQGTLTDFAEEQSGNRCRKLEIRQYKTDAEGRRSINLCIRIGGGKNLHGFPCEPNTRYSFSLEIKGSASRAMINFYEWDDAAKTGYGNRKKGKTSVHLIHPQKEWTVYRGTFKTGPTAKRAALCVQFWGDEKHKDLPEKPGDHVLIDKIQIEKEASHSNAQ